MNTLLIHNLGVRAFENRNYKAALEHFSRVLEVDPGNLSVREYVARAHYHRASLGPAEAECRRILEQDPANSYVTLLLARSLERQSRHDEAAGVRRMLAALTGDPGDLVGDRLTAAA